jgi:L-ascorbate metabolism protein UlaG (beta-lactamase superfamily)
VIKPALQDDAFLADAREALASPDEFRLWWLGQSGFLVRTDAGFAVLDPYLSDTLTRKYAHTEKPHVRMSDRVVAPDRLDFINIITSSHNHTDHLDPETVTAIRYASPRCALIVPLANVDFIVDRLGIRRENLTPLEPRLTFLDIFGFRVIPVPAAHESLDRDDRGHHHFIGYVLQSNLSRRPWTIYHSGDTILYDGMVEKLRPFNIDVAILPINGRSPERRVAGNLWGREAAWLAKEIGAKLVIPCHYDMFEFNTATPDEFVAECQRLGQPYRVLKLGERWSSTELDHR